MKDLSLLYRFFEGLASVEETRKIKSWCDADERNFRILIKERKLYDAIILTSTGQRYNSTESHKNRPIWSIMKIASIILLVILSSYLSAWWANSNNKSYEAAMQRITVPAGQRVNVTLPDGTDIWLNAKSTLTYPVNFMKDKREVTLDGEGYFDVTKKEGCPFIVHTSCMDIAVLGTKFNVEAYSSTGEFEASLLQGLINIHLPGSNEPLLKLQPQYKAVLKDGKLYSEHIENYNVFRWKEGLYCFKDKSFRSLMDDLEKYFDVNIEISEDCKVSNSVLTGKFRLNEGLDYILRVLQSDVPFTYMRDTNDDTITVR